MNFLAHLYLSGEREELRLGNFIGDFVKGRTTAMRYSAEIIKGIELHRAIDQFTDAHEVVKTSKVKLRHKYRHYAGVITDVFYDHFLAKHWLRYHQTPLSVYAQEVYHSILSFEEILPAEVRYMMPYMIKGNWLVHYASTEGVNKALTGMSHRTKFDSRMDEAVGDLLEHYEAFEEEFQNFFPALIEHCRTRMAELDGAS